MNDARLTTTDPVAANAFSAVNLYVFEAMPGNNALVQIDAPSYTIIAVTEAYAQTAGREKDALIGKGLFDAFPANVVDTNDTGEANLRMSFEEVIRTKKPHQLPVQRYDVKTENDGYTERFWSVINKPVLDADSNLLYILHTATEITDQIKHQQTAEKARQLEVAHKLFMQAPVAIHIIKGPELIIELANPPTLRLWGKGPEVVGMPLEEALPEIKGKGIAELLHDVRLNAKTLEAYETSVILVRNGKEEEVYVNFIFQPYFEDGLLPAQGVLVAAGEVTEQVVAKNKASESEESLKRFKFFADNVTDFIGMCDLQGKPLYVNSSGRQKVGLATEDQMLQTRLTDYFFPEDVSFIQNEFVPRIIKDGSGETEIRFRHFTTGEPIWMLYNVSLLKDGNDIPYGLATISRDITMQKSFAAQLTKEVDERTAALSQSVFETRQASERLAAVFNNSQSGMFMFAPVTDESGYVTDFRFVITNPRFAAYVGQTPEVLNGALGSTWFPGYLHNGVFDMYKKTYLTGETLRIDVHYDVDQHDLYLDLMSTKVGHEVLVTFTDYTPLKRAQFQLEKYIEDLKRSNANLEEFAYAASHDLKEPVRKIQFFSERIKTMLADRMNTEEKLFFERMEVASKRMGSLIDDLLAYSQVNLRPKAFEEVDMNSLINVVLNDLDVEIEQKQAVMIVDQLFTTQGYHRQLQQAFQNLISNSLKYSHPHVPPQIHISATEITGKEAGLDLPGIEARQNYHQVTIKDNGIGFEQKDADRIFNVFTRLHGNAEFRGTGVGLAIVRKVIENHGGFIAAQSKPGQGAIFTVYLPAITENKTAL